MAYRIAAADGSWTTAATWYAVDATSLSDSQANNTALGTTDTVSTATFTPGAITIDGIALKVATRAASPSGTMTVTLFNSTDGTTTTSVTINVSDIASNTGGTAGSSFIGCSVGWVFFKFLAPQALTAGKAYRIRAKTSATSQVNLFRDATAGNWSRMLRTTTTGAPAAGDSMFILKEWTAAATGTARIVTMDETANTDYGGTSATLASIGIGDGCTLQYATASATNYYLKCSGVIQVWVGGTFTIGTSGSPVPSNSTAVLEFDCAATGDFGVVNWGTMSAQGVSCGRSRHYTFLASDIATNATTMTVTDATGWLTGDLVAIAGTRLIRTENESKVLAADMSTGTSMSITVGVSNVHYGAAAHSSVLRAEVINYTRNVIIRNGTNFGAYICLPLSQYVATADFDYVQFKNMAGTENQDKSGIHIGSPVNLVTIDHCAFWNNSLASSYVIINLDAGVSAPGGSFSMSDIIHVETSCTGISGLFNTGSQTYLLNAITLTDIVTFSDSNSGGSPGISVNAGREWLVTRYYSAGGTRDGWDVVVGSTSAAGERACNIHWDTGAAHSCSIGVDINGNPSTFKATNVNFWFTFTAGISYSRQPGLTSLNTVYFLGCTADILADSSTYIEAFNCKGGGHAIRGSTSFVELSTSNTTHTWKLVNCQFGNFAAPYIDHTVGTLNDSLSGGDYLIQCVFDSCEDSNTTTVNTSLATCMMGPRSFIAYANQNGAANTHQRVQYGYATTSYDTTTSRTASPAEKITMWPPTQGICSANFPFDTSPKYVTVNSGSTVTVSTYVLKNTAYTGSAPKLILKANAALGVTADTVLDTHTAAAEAWEQLTGTTPAATEDGVFTFVIRIDGSAGAVWTDDWSAS